MKVTVQYHNPNYGDFYEDFSSLTEAAETQERRDGDRYYPLWSDTWALAWPTGGDPADPTHEGRFTRNGYFRWTRVIS